MAQGTTSGARPDHAGDLAQSTLSILLVDDDVELCELLHEFFARRNIRLEAANNGTGDWPGHWAKSTTWCWSM